MTSRKIKLISCRAIAHILEPLLDDCVETVILDISLHLNPEKLRTRLLDTIADIEVTGMDIILGYGLCGRALEGVFSSKCRLILPRVDDCVGAILGSRNRHQTIMAKQTGSYFLEPAWLETELDIFHQSAKGLDRIPEERKSQIIQMTLKHYSKLAMLDHADVSPEAACYCQKLARDHNLRGK